MTASDVEVAVRRLAHAADLPLPAYASEGAAGLDLRAATPDGETLEIQPGERRTVPTGLCIALPPGYEAQVRPRSGLARRGVSVVLGTVDSDYRGEVFVNMHTIGTLQSYRVQDGDRIAQLVVARVELLPAVEVEELSDSQRGDGGYGSTGR
jgi:dUTP pyrophosphatase